MNNLRPLFISALIAASAVLAAGFTATNARAALAAPAITALPFLNGQDGGAQVKQ